MQEFSTCENCGYRNLYGQRACGKCGMKLLYSCPRCGADINNTFLNCPKCFQALDWPTGLPASSRAVRVKPGVAEQPASDLKPFRAQAPKRPMNFWLIVSMALMGIVLLLGGIIVATLPASKTESSPPPGVQQTPLLAVKEASAMALTLQDLPSGWSIYGAPSYDKEGFYQVLFASQAASEHMVRCAVKIFPDVWSAAERYREILTSGKLGESTGIGDESFARSESTGFVTSFRKANAVVLVSATTAGNLDEVKAFARIVLKKAQ